MTGPLPPVDAEARLAQIKEGLRYEHEHMGRADAAVVPRETLEAWLCLARFERDAGA